MPLRCRLATLAIALFSSAALLPRSAAQISRDDRELPAPSTPRPISSPANRPLEVTAEMLARYTLFPPTPPVYGAKLAESNGRAALNGHPLTAPEEIADMVGESLYSALGTRLFRGTLKPKIAGRLAAYRAKRTTLVDEIQNVLGVTAAAAAADRERQLRELARSQEPRIAALEKEADAIREDLIHGSWTEGNADWGEQRGWQLGTPTVPANFVPNAEFQVLRAAAFYEPGLSPEQRGLVRELAMEQRETARAGRFPTPRGNRDLTAIYFSPETARLPLPAGLPPVLQDKIGTYSHDKDALKRELRDAIVGFDSASAAKRTAALRALAEKQWPRLGQLADLAESIRHDLAALPPPPLPALPPQLPPGLSERITAYQTAREALNRERAERRNAAARSGRSTPPVGSNREEIARQMRHSMEEHLARLQELDRDFLRENAERYTTLHAEEVAILAALDEVAKLIIDPATHAPMDLATLRRRLGAADQAFEKIGREEVIYRDYRLAMLEPGLSPAQRRLLFTSALAGLAQALPPPEPLPGEHFMPVW